MEYIDWISLILDLIITIFTFCLIPFILFVTKHKYEDSKAKKIAIINSIVVYILFFVVNTYTLIKNNSSSIEYNNIYNIFPAMLCGYINYNMLHKSKKQIQKEKLEEPMDNDLTDLLNKLENKKEDK